MEILAGEITLPLSVLSPFHRWVGSVHKGSNKGNNLLIRAHFFPLTLLHSERPKLYAILAFQGAIGLNLSIPSGFLL